MGNQCCRDSDEKQKSSGFVPVGNNKNDRSLSNTSSPNSSTILTSGTNSTPITNNVGKKLNASSNAQSTSSNVNGENNGKNALQSVDAGLAEQHAAEREEKQRALEEEQRRLEDIIALAGQDMVPLVHRTGGSMNSLNSRGSAAAFGHGGGGYYDPGYANLIMQDLSRTLYEYNQILVEKEASEDNNQKNIQKKSLFQQYKNIPQTCILDDRDAIDALCAGSNSRRKIEMENDLDVEDMTETFVASVLCTKEALLKVGPIVENVLTG